VRKLLIVSLVLFASLAFGQSQPTYMQITAANISGSGGLLPSGTLTFSPVDSTGAPISYQLGNGGQQVTFPTVCSISNGAIIGTCQLANVSITNPVNVCFSATVSNQFNQVILGGPQSGYTCVQPIPDSFWCTDTACNFDQYIPNLPSAVIARIPLPTALSIGGVFAFNCPSGQLANGIGTNGKLICGSGSGTGDVNGPGSSIIGDVALWADTSGTTLSDSGFGFPLDRSHIGTLAPGSNGLGTFAFLNALPNPLIIPGIVTGFNGLTTAGLGVPAIYGSSNVVGQSGSLGTTSIITSTAAAGSYRISYYIDQNSLCGSGANMVQLTFNWTDATASRSAQSVILIMGSTQSTPTGSVQGMVPIYAALASSITYVSTVTGACSTGGPSTYDVHVTAEQIQ